MAKALWLPGDDANEVVDAPLAVPYVAENPSIIGAISPYNSSRHSTCF